MKKLTLSVMATLTLGVASASATQFYVNEEGQVFTKPATDRSPLKADTKVSAKADKLKFSGLHYLGYTFKHNRELNATSPAEDTGKFELAVTTCK